VSVLVGVGRFGGLLGEGGFGAGFVAWPAFGVAEVGGPMAVPAGKRAIGMVLSVTPIENWLHHGALLSPPAFFAA
jgi:hypothetical protein